MGCQNSNTHIIITPITQDQHHNQNQPVVASINPENYEEETKQKNLKQQDQALKNANNAILQANNQIVKKKDQPNETKMFSVQSNYIPYYKHLIKYYQMNSKDKAITQQQKDGYKELLIHLRNCYFKFDGIQKTCDLVYKLYCLDYHNIYPFWALALHILIYFGKNATGDQQDNQNFKIEEQINKKIQDLAKKYPPTTKDIVKGADKIKNFKQDPLPDLLQGRQYNGIEQFNELVQELNQEAHKTKDKFVNLLQQIFRQKGNLKTFKAGTKLPTDQTSTSYLKSMIRIVQKTFCNYIDYKSFRNQADYNGSYSDYYLLWEESINSQIYQLKQLEQSISFYDQDDYYEQQQQEGQEQEEQQEQAQQQEQQEQEQQENGNEEQGPEKVKVRFQIYDLLRAKCQFNTVDDIVYTIQLFKKAEKQNKLKIVVIKNRLNNGTKDVSLNIQIDNIVCEVQLALMFDSTANQFNHKLYELTRDPAGVVIASYLMIFSDDQVQMEYYRTMMASVDTKETQNCLDYYITAIQQFFPSQTLFLRVAQEYYRERKHKKFVQPSIKGWNGFYEQYGAKSAMQFEQFQLSVRSITGRGIDDIGMFIINGTILENHVKFVKKYIKKHKIFYSGNLTNKNKIVGFWGFQQNQRVDKFMITKN